MGEHLMAVFQLDTEISRGQHLDHAALELYVLLSTHRRREPYALWFGWSTMSTPPESPANTGITDDFDDAHARASRARDPNAAGVRYIEDPHELLNGHAVELLRNGAETFPAW